MTCPVCPVIVVARPERVGRLRIVNLDVRMAGVLGLMNPLPFTPCAGSLRSAVGADIESTALGSRALASGYIDFAASGLCEFKPECEREDAHSWWAGAGDRASCRRLQRLSLVLASPLAIRGRRLIPESPTLPNWGFAKFWRSGPVFYSPCWRREILTKSHHGEGARHVSGGCP